MNYFILLPSHYDTTSDLFLCSELDYAARGHTVFIRCYTELEQWEVGQLLGGN